MLLRFLPARLTVFVLTLGLLALGLGCSGEPDEASDLDGDGVLAPEDCDDTDPNTLPGAGELCDDADNDCDGVVDEGYDEDGDGFNTCGPDADCDDLSPEVHEGVEEVCDGVDNNCDGQIDEGEHHDGDGDGFCDGADCDDLNPDIFPGASDVCDGIDNDCDGAVDPGYDNDGDGYSTCPGGGDCDDTDAEVNPVAIEVCNGADEDCDGWIDEDFDGDNDGWTTCSLPVDCDDGSALTYPGAGEICDDLDNDCDDEIDEDTADDDDGDGYTGCAGDCNDSSATVHPDAPEYPDGLDNDCDGEVDGALGTGLDAGQLSPRVSGDTTLGNFGQVLATGRGSFDGGPLSDFVVGSPLWKAASTDSQPTGKVDLFLGVSFLTSVAPAGMDPFVTITGSEPGDFLGYSAALSDINGDTYADLLIGAPQMGVASPQTPYGAVYIYFGSPVLSQGEWPLAAADVTIFGDFPTEQCGTAVAGLGDVNGDGFGDLGFTCPWYNSGDGQLRGRTVVFFGRSTWAAAYDPSFADATILGGTDDEFSGQVLVGDFDMNGDSLADFAVGSPDWSGGAGRVGVRFGATAGWAQGQSMDAMDRLWTDWQDGTGAQLGVSVNSGDFDADGYGDLLIGRHSATEGRGSLVAVGGAPSPAASSVIWYVAEFVVQGNPSTDDATGSAAAIVDFDDDGLPDLAVSSPGFDGPLGGDQGRVSILSGPLFSLPDWVEVEAAETHILGEAEGDALGTSLVGLDDFNSDGHPDLVFSAPYNDTVAGNAGRIYFLPGS